VTEFFVQAFRRTFVQLLGAQDVSTIDLESFGAVLRVGIDRIGENLS
jgi:hypothetical protein